MSDPTITPNSLVIYRARPARVVSVAGDKLSLDLEGGEAAKVRPKDVSLLHPGPLHSLADRWRAFGYSLAFVLGVLPALLTVQSGINLPRYASLSNRLRARSQAIDAVAVRPLEIPDAGLAVGPVFVPPRTPGGEILTGTPEEKARKLIERLHAKSIL